MPVTEWTEHESMQAEQWRESEASQTAAGQEWIAPYAAVWPEDAAQQGVESQAEVVEYSAEAAPGDHQEEEGAEWPDEHEEEQGEVWPDEYDYDESGW